MQRFPRSTRLAGTADYQKVFANPQRFGGHGYVLLVRPNGRSEARLGLAISKRYARRAIDRNRLKRIARESFRTNRHRLPAVDIIVLCDRRASTLSNECLFSALMNAWKALGSTAWQGS